MFQKKLAYYFKEYEYNINQIDSVIYVNEVLLLWQIQDF